MPLRILLIAACVSVSSLCIAREPRPLVVAHRGLLRHAPENTLANFRACLELRIGFEFDVQRTRDGHLVCIHDSTVDRTTTGTGRVADLTLDEIRRLDAGSWFDTAFEGERVPTIEEVLALIANYRQHDVLIAVDLKTGDAGRDVVHLAQKHEVLDRLLFIGRTITDGSVRRQIRAASPQARVAAVANNADEFADALAADADRVYFRYVPSEAEMTRLKEAGKQSFIAGPTVAGHEPENWRRLAQVGIDAILTDYPLELQAMLRSQPD
ncbi:Glycerophosphoryl diester phosphodiesterase [Maioricimonas rarisocia]|uniref:Glycerophosphoryl diester phosphodiesterase n=1 Tax=Maioricimonas rarisocia TaxID=2528026 RepID=A0A517Z753_9PLAN|nr:glycerophosphodiester phosphodiesterase family protein [Maioricimonas rarisocia]QDU38322.1 Glycerophosphoryl diester phosphodiesterase [Maioricimonas rarisocia]